MFSDLHSKISKDLTYKGTASHSQSLRGSITANSRTNSNESLASLGSATGSVCHKSDRIRHLESKVTELGSLIRQKNTSLEAANIEIEKLKKDLEKARFDSQAYLEVMHAKHAEDLTAEAETASEDDEKQYTLLSEKLHKAEHDLQSVNRLSDELSKQNKDLRLKTGEELENLKTMLQQRDLRLQEAQLDLDSKVAEIQHRSAQMIQLQSELEMKNNALEELKLIHSKMLETQLAKEDASHHIRSQYDSAEQRISELSDLFEKAKASAARQEVLTLEANDRASESAAELEKLRSRLATAEVIAADRESDLKDRIRILEERLVLLTEPSSDLFASEMAEAGKDLFDSNASVLADGASPEAVRCMSLLVERKLLETRLIDTRKHLEEVKTNWNETLLTLESQIAHLNGKIADDNAEHEAAQAFWNSTRQHLEGQLTEVSSQLVESKEKLQILESEIVDCRRLAADKDRDWELKVVATTTRLSALQQKSEDDAFTLAQSVQRENELQTIITNLRLELVESVSARDELNVKLVTLQAQIDEQASEIHSLRKELESAKSSNLLYEDGMRESERKCELLLGEKSDLATTITLMEQMLEKEKQAHKSTSDGFESEIAQLKSDCRTTKSLLAEAQQSLLSSNEEYRKANSELEELQARFHEKHAQLELDKINRDSTEIATLKATIESLTEKISDRNKTIRLQKQKLGEFKRALGQGLQGLPSSTAAGSLADEDIPIRLSVVSQADPCGVNQQFFPSHSPSLSEVDGTLAQSCESTNQNSPSVAKLPVQTMDQHCDRTLNHTSDMDTINFGYLRHVLLKFLLSKESEALQLVRAVSALLRLSKEDEFLIRQNLESRRSWFPTPVVSPKKSGQFAKVISPSL